jgi:hypothetical protein
MLPDVDLHNHMFMFCFNWSLSVTIALNAFNGMIPIIGSFAHVGLAFVVVLVSFCTFLGDGG